MRRTSLRTALALVAVLCAGVACASVAAPPPAARAADIPQIRKAVVARLHARLLSYRWVACVATGRSYRGQAVVRCNVNYGDPHIVAYCSILVRGRLVTQLEDRRIPCREDRAGDTVVIVTGP
jgi:hypothetical protein